MDSSYDTEAGVAFLQGIGLRRVALVGHSFSGAVVIFAAPTCEAVVAVAALASQTYGARNVDRIAPRPLLLVHGTADTRLDCYCSEQIYSWAKKRKELVLIEGASHGLSEHPEVLLPLLSRWLKEKLTMAAA
jgi:pimeloyl-ACP methyl ester carboxylesterase